MPRRAPGQVFTPRPIADWMAAWVCQHRPATLLDPSFGRGVFVDSVAALMRRRRVAPSPQVDAYEIDGAVLQQAQCPPGLDVRIRRQDFILAATHSRYDAILANPPYIRHHQFRYADGVWRTLDRLAGRPLSRMTNLYGLFLVKIWSLLAPGGRAAVITPAEWLNADFGVPLKTFLLAENALDAVVHFAHAENVFDGVLTTASITLLRRGRGNGEPIRLFRVHNAEHLTALSWTSGKSVRRDRLSPDMKWTPLFAPGEPLGPLAGPVLGDIARCRRGIATGANDYFTLRLSDLKRWGISRSDVVPCITSADQIRSDSVTRSCVRRLIDKDYRVFLLRPRRALSASVKRYLAVGEARGVHRRYLPAHRPVWFMPEQRPPAPILVTVFARGAFRFVRNRAGVLNLTAYHGIYPRDVNELPIQRLVEYFNGPAAQNRLRRHCRIYADGLFKLEPRDVESLPITRFTIKDR